MAKKATTAKATKLKECDWVWVQTVKDKWTTDRIPDGECMTPKITQSSKDSKGEYRYYCYRDSRYLGSHRTLEEAKERCWIGEMTRENEVFITFQKEHPGVIPPGIGFTPADWHEWKRSNPMGPGSGHMAEATEKKTQKLVEKAEKAKAKEAATAEKAAKVANGEVVPKVRVKSKLNMDGKIKILKKGNPNKVGGGPWKRWEVIFKHDGKLVKDYIAAGGVDYSLKNAVKDGYAEIT
jgi:hypothetical protein